jgi:hypothetical protein
MTYPPELAALKALIIKSGNDAVARINGIASRYAPIGTPPADPVNPAQTPKPNPIPVPIPSPVVPSKLPPLDFTNMYLWNWDSKWFACDWPNDQGPIPWKFDHIKQSPTDGSVDFKLDANGAPALQAMNGTPEQANGLWEIDVTLPVFRSGVCVAPLWLWNQKTLDEIDFEFNGKAGLLLTMHVGGVLDSVELFKDQDLSGTRHRFGIRVDQPNGMVDMLFDGVVIKTWAKAAMKQFISSPFKAWVCNWVGNDYHQNTWLGKFTPFGVNESLDMTVHGYSYTPL